MENDAYFYINVRLWKHTDFREYDSLVNKADLLQLKNLNCIGALSFF